MLCLKEMCLANLDLFSIYGYISTLEMCCVDVDSRYMSIMLANVDEMNKIDVAGCSKNLMQMMSYPSEFSKL